MPATSIFMRALSSGMSGIGYSRISVLLDPVRTAASTFSATETISESLLRRHAARDRLHWRPAHMPTRRALVAGAGAQQRDLVVGAADELHRKRQPGAVEARRDRQRRVAGEVEWC